MPTLRSMLRLYHYAQNYAGMMHLALKLRRFYDVCKIKPKFTRFLFITAQLQLDNSISHFMIKFHKRLFSANTFNCEQTIFPCFVCTRVFLFRERYYVYI